MVAANIDENASTIPIPPREKPRVMSPTERVKAYGMPCTMRGGKLVPDAQWERTNIVGLTVPWPMSVTGQLRIRVHRVTLDKWRVLFAKWEQAGLLQLLLTYNGSQTVRMKRGHEGSTNLRDLSTHSFGAAVDFNAAYNVRGTNGAGLGHIGSMEPLVPIAEESGFVWGGHFPTVDKMHIEVAA